MITIFYVDDDHDDLDFFQEATRVIGNNAVLFALGDDMIKAIHNPPPAPSIVFLDLNMPFKSGYDVMSEIKQSAAFHELPLVVYSTAKDEKTIEKCRLMGASMFISKPTSLNDIVKVIRHVIAIDWSTFCPTNDNFVYKG